MSKRKTTKGRKSNRNQKAPVLLLILLILAGLFFIYCKSTGKISFENGQIKIEKPILPQTGESQNQNTAKAKPGFVALPDRLEYPLCDGAKNAPDHERRKFKNYELCYRESYEQAEWSAYKLSKDELKKSTDRTNDFRPDPEISTGSSTLSDYKGSGYDRGHLTPAADMSFDKNAMSETFYMSNMSPQAPQFNRGIWQQLEAQVRKWAKTFGSIYVVSGPILEKNAGEYATIGKNKVSIPQYYYKAVLIPLYEDEADRNSPEDAKNIAALGFILPNNECKGKTFWDFAVPVNEIEKRTGLDLFSLLEDSAEEAAESEFDLSVWK